MNDEDFFPDKLFGVAAPPEPNEDWGMLTGKQQEMLETFMKNETPPRGKLAPITKYTSSLQTLAEEVKASRAFYDHLTQVDEGLDVAYAGQHHQTRRQYGTDGIYCRVCGQMLEYALRFVVIDTKTKARYDIHTCQDFEACTNYRDSNQFKQAVKT